MKKILFLFLFLICFGKTNAELLDYLENTSRYSVGFSNLNTNSGAMSYTFTGVSLLQTGSKLYLKSIDCYFRNYDTSLGDIEFELTLSPNSNFTSNYIITYENLGTGGVLYKSYPVNQVMSGTNLYYQQRKFYDISSLTNISFTTCYMNGTYFSNYYSLSSNSGSMSTGSIVINNNLQNESINIFQSNESMKEFYIFEFIFIMLLMIIAFLFRLIKF